MLVEAPSMDSDDIDIPDPFPVDESCLEAIAYAVEDAGDTHFVVGRLPSVSLPWRETVGLEEFLTRMITDPPFIHKAMTYYRRQLVAYGRAMLELGVDALLEGSDYCDNRGVLMGPARFREFIWPAMKDLADLAHSYGRYFIKHTDGNCWAILDDFVEAGIDGWQGIQPRIGMDLRLLKEKYAGKLCLLGGVNCETLTLGSPAQVAEEVRYAIRHAAPGGGLVLASGNTLQYGTKWENYAAMREATRQHGHYPIAPDV
jgi:uroporphyrinogen decarboxylase